MSRHHHRPAHRRGWAAHPGAGDSARRGGGVARCGRPGRLEVHHPRGRCLRAATHDASARGRVPHLSPSRRHHRPDPARLAWAKFSRRGVPMLKSIETALKLSEIREKLNESERGHGPDRRAKNRRARSDCVESENNAEVEYRSALTAEADEHATVPVNGEDREYRCAPGARQRRAHLVGVCGASQPSTGPNWRSRRITDCSRIRSRSTCYGLPVEHRAVTTGPDERRHDRATGDHAGVRVGRRGVSRRVSPDRTEAGLVAYPVLDQRPDVGGPHTDSARASTKRRGSFSVSSLLDAGPHTSELLLQARRRGARFPVIDTWRCVKRSTAG